MWRLITTGYARRGPGLAALARQAPSTSPTLLQRALATETTSTTSASGGAGAVDPSPASFGAPPGGANTPKDTRERLIEYHRFTDIYLGGLWNRMEAELRRAGADAPNFEYDVQLTSGCMRVALPSDAEVIICKEPGEQALRVESNLHDIFGGGDPRDEAVFKLGDDGEFADGGVALHQYLEDHMAKHLNVKLDLEPQPGPHDKVYGADPT